MTEFQSFVTVGIRHIIGPGAADHLLFLLILAAGMDRRSWRRAAATVSAFTVGHSLTLAFTVTGLAVFPESVVEVLIPLTIAAAAVHLAATAGRSDGRLAMPAGLAFGFGLIHGAGFAGYLRGLLHEDIAVPLAGFNIGIEVAQIAVLATFAGLVALTGPLAARAHVRAAVSLAAGGAALVMAAGRVGL